MIAATADDRPAIEAFLSAQIATSMFPLSNLRRYGMDGGHPRAMRFWLDWQEGRITDALGLSEEGFLFPQCPSGDWGKLSVILKGWQVKGMLGETGQVTALRRFLTVAPQVDALDTVDPLYTLSLDCLQMPDMTGFTLAPLGDDYRAIATRWRCAYLQEVMPIPGENPQEKAAQDIAAYTANDMLEPYSKTV